MRHAGAPAMLGVPEPVGALVDPVLVTAMVWRHRTAIAGTDRLLLLAASVCLAHAVAIDLVPRRLALKELAEKMAKLVGIVFGCA